MNGGTNFDQRGTKRGGGFVSRGICVLLASIHLLVLAGSTYAAAVHIKSILTTGWICSLTGVLCGLAGWKCRRTEIAIAGFATVGIAILLWGLEGLVLNLGPQKAMLPFCIVFFVNSLLSTLIILVGLRLLFAPRDALKLQLSLSTLLVAMTTFGVFLGIARVLLFMGHNWLMTIALGLAGLTMVGLGATLYATVATASKRSGLE